MREPKRRVLMIGILFGAQGVFYLVFSLWLTIINPLRFGRTPPLLKTLAYAFLFVMLVVGVYFIVRAFTLLAWARLSRSDFYVSIFSIVLWVLPAQLSFGNAHTYLTTAPHELRFFGYIYLMIGVLFLAIGIINIASVIYLSLLRGRQERHVPS